MHSLDMRVRCAPCCAGIMGEAGRGPGELPKRLRPGPMDCPKLPLPEPLPCDSSCPNLGAACEPAFTRPGIPA